MKKQIIISVMAVLIMAVLAVPAMAAEFSLGIEHEEIGRDMNFKNGDMTVTVSGVSTSNAFPSPGDSIANMEMDSSRAFIRGEAKLHEAISVFVKAGTANVDFEYDYISPGSPDEEDRFDGKSDFAWGAGARIKLMERSGFKLTADAEYLTYEVDGQFFINGRTLEDEMIRSFAAIGLSATASASSSTEVEEWSAGLTASKKVSVLEPYLGIRYLDAKIKNKTNVSGMAAGIVPYSASVNAEAENSENFGFVVGIGANLSKNLKASIEGRFLNETAGKVGIIYTF